MRLATFSRDDRYHLGVVVGSEVVDLSSHIPALPRDMSQFLGLGEAGLDIARAAVSSAAPRYDLNAVTLMAPIPRPSKVFGIGMNYRSFVATLVQMGAPQLPAQRIWFSRQQACVAGPNDDVWMPRGSEQLDYEGELAVIIGARCRSVGKAQALDFIAGYTVCNDLTVRDWAAVSPILGKSMATHAPMGPWITTADEVGDPQNLAIETTVNGTKRQVSNTEDMMSTCAELIAELSAVTTLEPGDVILTGTPGGCGVLQRPAVFLQPGDEVRVSVEGVGDIVNRVVEEPV